MQSAFPPISSPMSEIQTIKRSSKKEFQTGSVAVSPGGGGIPSTYVSSSIVAGESVGSPRVVMIEDGECFLFDPSIETNMYKRIGVTRSAVAVGDSVDVVICGELNTGAGVAQDSIYYAGPNGTLVTVPPTSGIIMEIGIAKDNDVLIVNLSTPYFLI